MSVNPKTGVCSIAEKQAYDKKGAITACNKRYREDHTLLRIYPCGNHWHLTKQLRGNHIIGKNKKLKLKGVNKGYTFDRE